MAEAARLEVSGKRAAEPGGKGRSELFALGRPDRDDLLHDAGQGLVAVRTGMVVPAFGFPVGRRFFRPLTPRRIAR